jgi:hypothetical protein
MTTLIRERPASPAGPSGADARLKGLDSLAWLMDRAIPIPGTKMRVGLDAILGLLPIGGDAMTGLVQAGIVLAAIVHYRVPKAVAARMAANVLLDVGLGALPIVGDVFDAFFKANTRNLALLREVEAQKVHHQPVRTWPSIAFLVAIAAVLILAVGLVFVGAITVLLWITGRPLF